MQSQLIQGVHPLYKHRGETLAVLLERFRHEYKLPVTAKLTYAGRLDPMAEGIVLILEGEARFQKDTLLGLPKEYEVEVVLGIGSDTHDVLGLITDAQIQSVDKNNIEEVALRMTTITRLPYPMYSSVPVDGKPLFMHARAGRQVIVPQKNVTISYVEILEIRNVSLGTLAQSAIKDIEKVQGDFRQTQIKACWENYITEKREVVVVKIKVACSSGTYMRSLAQWMGKELGMSALAYSIKRVQIGNYK